MFQGGTSRAWKFISNGKFFEVVSGVLCVTAISGMALDKSFKLA